MGCPACKFRGWHVNVFTRQQEPCPSCEGKSQPVTHIPKACSWMTHTGQVQPCEGCNGKLPLQIPENCPYALYNVLKQYASKTKPKSYLEVGVREGASLSVVLQAAEGSIELLTLCDKWGDDFGGSNRQGHEHIQTMLDSMPNAPKSIIWLDGDSKEKLLALSEAGGPWKRLFFDMILIDGDHTGPGVTVDMENAWKVLAPNGIMIVDDIDHPAHPDILPAVMNFHKYRWNSGCRILNLVKDKPMGVAVLKKVKENV